MKNRDNAVSFVLYILSFLLLWEWMRPVEQLTDTGNIYVFVGFIFLAATLSFLRVHAGLAVVMKLVYIFIALSAVHYDGALLEGFARLPADILGNLSKIWAADWLGFSHPFRTFLFFILIWLIAYLIDYWVITKKRLFLFFLMTIVLITVLDTFTAYDGEWAIVRTVFAGFASLAILLFLRLADQEMLGKFAFSRKWVIPLVLMIVGSTSFAYAAPKSGPIWPDPVPFLKSLGSEGGGGVKRLGYGVNDSQLGGPFVGDDTVVFRTEVEERHYWKVETKNLYTGKGWEASREADRLDFTGESIPLGDRSTLPVTPDQVRTSKVFNVKEYHHLQYPHGVSEILTGDDFEYRLNTVTEKILSYLDDEPTTPKEYSVKYQQNIYHLEKLREGRAERDDYFQSNMEMRSYKALPENLPPEIEELAKEITAEADNWYDKAKAVESYFGTAGFIYDQVNVEVPDENEDYVAQFLFESKRGYCDNFSTAMAVMLRTLDIPTRWVKGYTAGEYVDTLDSGVRQFEVTNNNAHSWVEVYIPETGWVPFEPTQGFNNYVMFEEEQVNEEGTGTETEADTPASAEPERPEQAPAMEEEGASQDKAGAGKTNFWEESGKNLLAGLLLLAAAAGLAYYFRGKWLPFYYILIFKSRNRDTHFPAAYLTLLIQLERYGLKRESGETLRDYAWKVDQFFSGKEMRAMTSKYEQFLYRGRLEEGTWEEVKPAWETLLKKSVA